MLRVQPGNVWQMASADVIVPGRQIYARNAEPVGIQGGLAAHPGSWRIGTVDRVDVANGLLYFRDGGVIAMPASTPVTMNGQRVAVSHIRPGAQVAVRVPTMTTTSQDIAAGYALPRSVIAPPAAAEILVYP